MRCPVGLRGAVSTGHQSRALKDCLLCCLPAPSSCGGTAVAAVGCWKEGLIPRLAVVSAVAASGF